MLRSRWTDQDRNGDAWKQTIFFDSGLLLMEEGRTCVFDAIWDFFLGGGGGAHMDTLEKQKRKRDPNVKAKDTMLRPHDIVV